MGGFIGKVVSTVRRLEEGRKLYSHGRGIATLITALVTTLVTALVTRLVTTLVWAKCL